MISSAFSLVNRVSYPSTCTCGFMSFRRSRADSSFGRPTSFVPCTICRCRFVTSTTSKSTSPIVPTPAAARYSASGEPSPPAPMSSTRLAFSRCCPSSATSGRMRCRLYRRISSDESSSSCVASGAVAVAMRSAPRDRRHDRELVAVAHRRVEAAVEPDVLVVQVERDERIRLARLVAQSRREVRVARGHVGHYGAHRLAVRFDLASIGQLGEDGGKKERYCHDESPKEKEESVCVSDALRTIIGLRCPRGGRSILAIVMHDETATVDLCRVHEGVGLHAVLLPRRTHR